MSQLHSPRPIRIALQGGGALGAFSWGALDALLESRRVELTHFSGASAGALNAAICASALARVGPEHGRREARRALASFWQAISASPWNNLMRLMWGPLARSVGQDVRQWLWASAMAAPYSNHYLPTMALTPLASILERHVDFDALQSPGAPAVFVSVTNVRSGLPRVLGNAELSIDALLASACLPQYFKPVEIEGEWYWDGGFTGNPTLWPLLRQPGPGDIALIQLSPGEASELPSTANGVRRRVAEVVFHSSLVAEMQAIAAIREQADSQGLPNPFGEARFHRIGPPPVECVERGSPSEPSSAYIRDLSEAGRLAAFEFLTHHGDSIGERETLDIRRSFFESPRTWPPLPSSETAGAPGTGRVGAAARNAHLKPHGRQRDKPNRAPSGRPADAVTDGPQRVKHHGRTPAGVAEWPPVPLESVPSCATP